MLENLWFCCISLNFSSIRTLTPHYTSGASTPPRSFSRFQAGFLQRIWRTSGTPCDMRVSRVFGQKRWFPPRWRPGVVVFTDGHTLGLFAWGAHWRVPRGPWATSVGPGRSPLVGPFGPFVAHLTRFLYHSLRALGLDRLSHLQVCRVCRRDPFPQKHACSMLRVNGTYPTTVLRHALRPAMARSWGACGRTTLPSQPATAIRRWLPAGHGGRGLGTCGAWFGAACVPYVLV
jgi:hypothetical protein